MKLLLLIAALAAFTNAEPADFDPMGVSFNVDFIQYLNPIVPSEEMLFSQGVLAAVGKCPATMLGTCQMTFAKRLNTNTQIFKDPVEFAKLIAGFYMNPFNKGILNLCAAQVEFRKCLTPVFYPTCTDALQIFKTQITDNINKAFILAGLYDDIEFDCGGGLTQMVENWSCINKVNSDDKYVPRITACYDAFNKSVSTGNDPARFCKAGQTMSLCLSDVYRQLNLCSDVAVQWWACERANRRVKLEGYCQPNTCSSLFPVKKNNEMSMEEYIESGGFFNQDRHTFFKLAGLPREQRNMAYAKHVQNSKH